MDFSTQQMKTAIRAKDPGALLALAEAEGIPMTEAEARAYFTRLHPPAGELADDELEAVSGGGCGGATTPYPVGTYVGIVDSRSSTVGELIRCGGCQGTRFVVTKVVDYDTVGVECVSHCKKAFSSRYGAGVIFKAYSNVNILSLKRL